MVGGRIGRRAPPSRSSGSTTPTDSGMKPVPEAEGGAKGFWPLPGESPSSSSMLGSGARRPASGSGRSEDGAAIGGSPGSGRTGMGADPARGPSARRSANGFSDGAATGADRGEGRGLGHADSGAGAETAS